MTTTVVWISGASSGIGAAIAASTPFPQARVVGIARRPVPHGEHLAADLRHRDGWRAVIRAFEQALTDRPDRALFLHFAGVAGPHGSTPEADCEAYADAVLLNGAAPQILGQAFLATCRRHGVPATLVLCSSPAAALPLPNMSGYGSGKSAVEYWTQSVAAESPAEPGARVLCVVPFAVDTPMLREAMAQPPDVNPIAADLRDAAQRGDLASPAEVAREVWAAVTGDAPSGTRVAVGAVPAAAATTTGLAT
jgi:benzil reductase ((S)-benzoin forming)